MARLLLRRLIGPIVLFEMPAPAWVAQYGREGLDTDDVTWEAPTKLGLLEGLARMPFPRQGY